MWHHRTKSTCYQTRFTLVKKKKTPTALGFAVRSYLFLYSFVLHSSLAASINVKNTQEHLHKNKRGEGTPKNPKVILSRCPWNCVKYFGGHYEYIRGFLRRFKDPFRVPRIRENYHRVPKTRENRAPRIREIGSLQIHTGFLTLSLKKMWIYTRFWQNAFS